MTKLTQTQREVLEMLAISDRWTRHSYYYGKQRVSISCGENKTTESVANAIVRKGLAMFRDENAAGRTITRFVITDAGRAALKQS